MEDTLVSRNFRRSVLDVISLDDHVAEIDADAQFDRRLRMMLR